MKTENESRRTIRATIFYNTAALYSIIVYRFLLIEKYKNNNFDRGELYEISIQRNSFLSLLRFANRQPHKYII